MTGRTLKTFIAALFGRDAPAPAPQPREAGATVLTLFRQGHDTRDIASITWLPEWQVLGLLQAARDAERAEAQRA